MLNHTLQQNADEKTMRSDQDAPEGSAPNNRPIDFRSTSEEVAVGTLMGSLIVSVGIMIASGLVGAVGASAGKFIGSPTLGGSVFVWLAFWILPLLYLIGIRPFWRFLGLTALGTVYLI